MPHHPVIKVTSETTNVRIVFDASAKTSNNISLNDLLMIGSTFQPKLLTQILKFRVHRYIITADIKKMYLQILLHPDDRKYLYIYA